MNFYQSRIFKLAFVLCFLSLASFDVSARGKINLDYDGKADFLVYRPSNGTWYGYRTESGTNFAVRWGISTDSAVPADYDGDGLTDVAVYRNETGTWYILRSRDNQMFAIRWGLASDSPVPADYDGDGHTDIAVERDGTWYILTSSSGYNPVYFQSRTLLPPEIPAASTVPVPADYDGDRKTDFAVKFGTSWFIRQSETGALRTINLPCELGVLAPADYTGDGYAEPGCLHWQSDVVYQWRYRRSQDNQQVNFFWGSGPNNDLPVPDDYDNDGHTDIAVYRSGQWWIYRSSTLQPYVFTFGQSGDVPAQWANLKLNTN